MSVEGLSRLKVAQSAPVQQIGMVEIPVLSGRLARFGEKLPKVGRGCTGGENDVGSAWADIYAGSHVS